MINLPYPRLIETPKYTGHYLSDIYDALTRAQRQAFHVWFAKRTGVLHNGRMLVYATDWELFLAAEGKRVEAEVEAADGEGYA